MAVICPSCGCELGVHGAYCHHCGTQDPESRGAAHPAPPRVREVRDRLPAESRRTSLALGLVLFTLDAVAYGAVWLGIVFVPGWPLKILLGVLAGILVGFLFIVGHDACHGSFSSRPAINKIVGRLAMLPGWHSYASWEFSHNGLHHGYTNLRGADPVYPPFSKAEFDQLSLSRQWLERIYRTAPGVGLFYWLEMWCKCEMFPGATHRARIKNRLVFELDRLSVAACAGAQSIILFETAARFRPALVASPAAMAGLLATGLLLPFAVWMWSMGFLTYQHHTHPQARWYRDTKEWCFYHGHLQGTVHIIFPRIVEMLMHNVMDHTAHHVDSKIPLYRLHDGQRALEDAFRADIVVEAWDIRMFLRNLAACQLYDFDNHRWQSFAGAYTT